MLRTRESGETAALAGAQHAGLVFADGYAQLPAHFYTRIDPTRVAEPRLIKFNAPLAAELGLDAGLEPDTLAAIFSGNTIVPQSNPIAMVYAGHQFGQF